MKNIWFLLLLITLWGCNNRKYPYYGMFTDNYVSFERGGWLDVIGTDERLRVLSDSIYAVEGDTIIGNFVAGMSKEEYDKLLPALTESQTTISPITLQGTDLEFIILNDSTKFVNNKLVSMVIAFDKIGMHSISIREGYSYSRGFYAEGSNFDDRKETKEELIDKLIEKYGPEHGYDGWHFLHKTIEVYSCTFYSSENDEEDEQSEKEAYCLKIEYLK